MGGVGPDYEEDVELTEDSDIEKENEQRKAAWLDKEGWGREFDFWYSVCCKIKGTAC